MARVSYATSNLPRLVTVEGLEGEYHLIRKGAKNARVISVNDKNNSGLVVEVAKITSERKADTPSVEAPNAQPVSGELPVAEAPAVLDTTAVEVPVAEDVADSSMEVPVEAVA